MPSAAILPASLAISRPSNRTLCSCKVLSDPYLFSPLSVSAVTSSYLASTFIIHMGGGPRTYPGGVSKWQWKRMQEKKAKQLLKAPLCRERQLYEMRKRAELKSAISELERPWEVLERAPVLFSASADEQVKVLADRFLRPSGFDMWSERDGPQLFRSPDNLPSARFFPMGSVHSVKPYGLVAGELSDGVEGEEKMRCDDRIARGAGGMGRGRRVRRVLSVSSSLESELLVPGEGGNGDVRGNRASYSSDSELVVAGSKKAEDEMPGGFGRQYGNRDSHGSDSKLALAGSRMGGDEVTGDFGRRGGRGRNSGSRSSDSELADAGSRMERHEMAGCYGRRGGRGGRSGYRGSYRAYSDLPVTRSSMEGDEIAGGFGKRGGRGGNRSFHLSDSELATADSRKGRVEMARGFNRLRGGGRDRGYSFGGRVSLRPSRESRLEEVGDGRRETKRREGSNTGFRANRGRRSPSIVERLLGAEDISISTGVHQ